MNEVATEPTKSSPKRDQVLAALAAGKSSAEAAKEAGCTRNYVYGIVREQKPSVSISVNEDESAELISALENEVPGPIRVDSVASPYVPESVVPGLSQIAELIWPYVMERVGGRYTIGDQAFEVAAKNALEAADCFLIKARGHSTELVRLALVVWPALWRNYGARGRYIKNSSVSIESAALAMSAAEKYLTYDSAPQG
jgi:DNA-binding CsgD family transcriptional regulator